MVIEGFLKAMLQKFVTKGFLEKFSSQEEFNKLENETFDKDIKNTIHAVTIAKTYLKGKDF